MDSKTFASVSLPGNSLADDVRRALIEANIKPIDALRPSGLKPDADFEIDGDLAAYIEALTALSIKTAFVEEQRLDETDFMYTTDDPSNGPSAGVDLRETDPSLRRFERYFGKCSLVVVTALYQGHPVSHWDSATWHTKFIEARDAAVKAIS